MAKNKKKNEIKQEKMRVIIYPTKKEMDDTFLNKLDNIRDFQPITFTSDDPNLEFYWVNREAREWDGFFSGYLVDIDYEGVMILSYWEDPNPAYEGQPGDEEIMRRFVCALMAK